VSAVATYAPKLDAAARARGRLVAVRVVMRAVRELRRLREEAAIARSTGAPATLHLAPLFQRFDQGLATWIECGGVLPDLEEPSKAPLEQPLPDPAAGPS